MFENATLRDGGVEEDFSATESITLKVEAKDDESIHKSMTNVAEEEGWVDEAQDNGSVGE